LLIVSGLSILILNNVLIVITVFILFSALTFHKFWTWGLGCCDKKFKAYATGRARVFMQTSVTMSWDDELCVGESIGGANG